MAKAKVRVKDGQLTVNAENEPLHAISDAISQQSGISILVTGDIRATMVSARLRQVPVGQGLRQLLGDWDVFVLYAGGQGDHAISRVWVHPARQGQGRQPAPTVPRAMAAADARPPLESQAATRVPTLDAKTEAPDRLESLASPDAEVRYCNLEEAVYGGSGVSEEVLQELMTRGPSDQMRELALEALVESQNNDFDGIRSTAEYALSDPSDAVRAAARRILERVDHLKQMDLEAGQGTPTPWGGRACRHRDPGVGVLWRRRLVTGCGTRPCSSSASIRGPVPLTSTSSTVVGFGGAGAFTIACTAECAVADTTSASIDIDIYVDGVPLSPTGNNDAAPFCSANTTPGFDGWSMNAAIGRTGTLAAGAHTVEGRARTSDNTADGWLGDSPLLIQKQAARWEGRIALRASAL